jgi:hypothetical protein
MGNQKVIKVKAINFKRALDKALSRYKHIKYHLPYLTKQKMNLAAAIKLAAKASIDTGSSYYVIIDNESKKGECTINSVPLGTPIMKFKNGVEDKEFTERHAKPEKNGKKEKPTVVSHNDFETIKKQKTITTMKNEKEVTKKVAAKKESPAKKSAPAKKVAAKKILTPATKKAAAAPKKEEKKAKRAKYTDGKKVTMSNKDMTAKIKKGYIYFNEKGVNKTNYIPERPNQDLVNKNYYEVAPK